MGDRDIRTTCGRKKKKKQRGRIGEKKRVLENFFTEEGRSAGDLNEGEKGKEGGGDRDTKCGEEIKKKTYGWNEKREKRNNIKNKISYLRNVTIIFSQ